MNAGMRQLYDTVFAAIETVYTREQARIAAIRPRSLLQGGIHNYLRITCNSTQLTLDTYEPFDWGDSEYEVSSEEFSSALDSEQFRREWLPAFEQQLQAIFESELYGEEFFRYKLDVYLEVDILGDPQLFHTAYISQPRREALFLVMEQYIQRRILSDMQKMKPDDDFHLLRNLLDPDLYATDLSGLDELLQQVEDRLSIGRKRLEQWRAALAQGFKSRAGSLLDSYFDRTGPFNLEYTRKLDAHQHAVSPEELQLLIYIALTIGPYEPEERKQYLELAVQLGSAQAALLLREGSGRISSGYTSPLVKAKANDVLQTVEIQIMAEEELAYKETLGYLCDLLRQGFPKSYTMKLKSKAKHFVPVPRMAKSKLHQFFGNALQYPALFPDISAYAAVAMEEFAWYNDVEPGEKSVMPGTYAVLGLGLADEAYFPLVGEYMKLVDSEHQSVQNEYAGPFIGAHGLTDTSIPLLVRILLAGSDNAKPLGLLDITTAEQAVTLVQAIRQQEKYEQKQLIYRIWGSAHKLKQAVKQASPTVKEQLEVLLQS